MSTPIDDGGPAFPIPDTVHANGQVQYGANGMSLRDWFAGQAMQGMLANQALIDVFGQYKGMSVEAYGYADAMLAARKGVQS